MLKRLPHLLRRSAFWVGTILRHPANRGGRAAALARAAGWHLRTATGRPVEAVVTVDGRTSLRVHPGQFSSVWTLYDGVHEWEELQLCLGFLRSGDLFVDVGANVGVFSSLVGTRLPGVDLVAVEPFDPTRAELELNLALNALEAEVHGCALGAEAGTATFEVLERDVLNRLAPTGGTTNGTVVEVRTLDDLLAGRRPALVKVDVEGAELGVLQGAMATLTGPEPPVLLFEHCGHGSTFGVEPADMRRFLEEVGYTMHLLDGALTRWDSDALPPTPNVVAATDIERVRARLSSAGGAPAVPPVRVQVRYTAVDA